MSSRLEIREVIDAGKKIRCVLAHDYVLMREGLRRLLEDEPDIEVVGEAGNAAECLRKTYELQPDVVIAGAVMFGQPAREAEVRVLRECPRARLVLVSRQEQANLPFGGLETGDLGVLHTSSQELLRMVRNSRISTRMSLHPSPMRSPAQALTEKMPVQPGLLTPREREVLKLLAEGNTVREAASGLGLSSKTVDAHKFNLMRKLGIHNKAELVMWAIQKKVIKVPVNF